MALMLTIFNLILRRPRSGRLEGWATYGIVDKAGSQHLALLPTLRDAALWAAPQGEVYDGPTLK